MIREKLFQIKKKAISNNKKFPFKKWTVIGSDDAARRAYTYLKNKLDSSNEICLLTDVQVEDRFDWLSWPSFMRGEVNSQIISRLETKNSLDSYETPVFYKEKTFHIFNKTRFRPYPLMRGEDFFTSPVFKINEDQFFSPDDIGNPEELNSTKKEDKVLDYFWNAEEKYWVINFTNGKGIRSENIVFGNLPQKFIDKIKNKEAFPEKFFKLFQSDCLRYSLILKFALNKTDLIEKHKTFFVPQSLTYDWGHFIGERVSDNCLSFLMYLGEHETDLDQELISKKRKILKRSLSKIFNGIRVHDLDDNIIVCDETPHTDNHDDLYEELMQNPDLPLRHIHFVGMNAPLLKTPVKTIFQDQEELPDLKNITHFARNLVSYNQFIQQSGL